GAIEQGDPMTRFGELQGEARGRAVETIEKWLSPDLPNYDLDRANLTQWSRGIDPLNASNQKILDAQVGATDRAFLGEVLPDGSPFPKDTANATLIDALRDRIDEGFLPENIVGGFRLNPSEKLLAEARDDIRRAVRADEDFGPRAFKDPNDPTNA